MFAMISHCGLESPEIRSWIISNYLRIKRLRSWLAEPHAENTSL